MATDFYAVLSLPRSATSTQIKARFRELARERHPDRFQGDERARAETEFQQITAAFNVLIDPKRRRQHEIDLERPRNQGQDVSQLARVYLNRGIRAYKRESYLEAADNFDRATKTEPDNPQAWHHLALTCLREERWLPKAREAVERACELRPRDVTYLKMAGKVFAKSGELAAARGYYERALRLQDSDPVILKALAKLGHAKAKRGKPKVSEKPRNSRFGKLW